MYRHAARFNRRRATTSQKAPFVIFNPHTLPPLLPGDGIVVMTVDPGIKNCAIRIAQYDQKNEVIRTIMQVKHDFTHRGISLPPMPFGENKSSIPGGIDPSGNPPGMDTAHFTNIAKVLDVDIEYFIHCHHIVIESQLPINYALVRMSERICQYLCGVVKDKGYRPLIFEIDPHLKSRMLGAPAKMTKPQLKKWCAKKAAEILNARGDKFGLSVIEGSGKKDDHGDTICMEAIWWMILRGELHSVPIPVCQSSFSSRLIEGTSVKSDSKELQAFLQPRSRLIIDDSLPPPVDGKSRLIIDE